MEQEKKIDVFGPENEHGHLKKRRQWKWIVGMLSLMLIAYGAYSVFRLVAPAVQTVPETETVTQKQGEDVSSPNKEPQSTIDSRVSDPSSSSYQSENFHVGTISVGGETETLFVKETTDPFAISEIRAEAFAEKNKPEVKLVISWKTNKLALSHISYTKGPGQTSKTVSEEDYTLNHSVIIPALDQATRYYYTIVSQDRFGNEITSDKHAVFTGSRTASLFDLISKAMNDIFGWAVPSSQ